MSEPKKLIEVAMPIKEISAESVRDKSIRSGHISTLHLWWARRPLPVCRAIIFASLVPDPLDENCSNQFKDAIELILGKANNPGDPYKPYEDIPYTSAIDKMEDNSRNRLMMFIGKFSEKYIENERHRKITNTKDLISSFSLIKWESHNDLKIIQKAKKLIFVAYNSKNGKSASELINEHDLLDLEIKSAQQNLYIHADRHIDTDLTDELKKKLNDAIENYLNKMPIVFDPFAGGGAIPLEAARLGCRSFGNDINPVAHIIQRASTEYPQKFGNQIVYSKDAFISKYGILELEKFCKENMIHIDAPDIKVNISNRLSFDVNYYSLKLLNKTASDTEYLYPPNNLGNKPIVYYWVRVGKCENPSCNADVPLLRQFYLSRRRGASESNYVHFYPVIEGNKIDLQIRNGVVDLEPFIERANLKCPICGSVTEVKKLKKQFFDKKTKEILAAVIDDSKGGKIFRKPTIEELEVFNKINFTERPTELMPSNDSQNLKIPFWGFKTFGEMFSDRQITVMNQLVLNTKLIEEELEEEYEYKKAISTYLAILLDRLAMRFTTFNTWHIQQDTIEKIMGKQAIPMVFDYPEMNPFTDYTSSAYGQLGQIIDYINEESNNFNYAICNNSSSGDKFQFKEKSIDVVVTDPPYYDAIAYADLSDFFYVWLKRTIGEKFELNFASPNTPKIDECTAIKHHHSGDKEKAKVHFESKLLKIFDAIEHQTKDIVSIMFAHQSTEAWTTLCNSILGARMNITGSWAVDTEVTGGLKEGKSYLSSSVTVSCKPINQQGFGEFKIVKAEIEKTVESEVESLYKLGLRGADLLTACFGKAVSEFGRYIKVEKADGSEVQVNELLDLARESAFNALLKGFEGDDFTKFYIGWLQLNGFVETDFDDAAKFTKVGLSINVNDLFREHILVKSKNKQHLASLRDRMKANIRIGEGKNSYVIDIAHKLMFLYDSPNRNNLLKFIDINMIVAESPIWRVLTSLAELLPKDIDDHKLAVGLLTNKDQLIREAKSSTTPKPEQSKLILE